MLVYLFCKNCSISNGVERTRLCREILVAKLYQFKAEIVVGDCCGGCWGNIADRLNECQIPTFKVTKRAVRDRYKIPTDKYKKKMREEGLKDFCKTSDILLFKSKFCITFVVIKVIKVKLVMLVVGKLQIL